MKNLDKIFFCIWNRLNYLLVTSGINSHQSTFDLQLIGVLFNIYTPRIGQDRGIEERTRLVTHKLFGRWAAATMKIHKKYIKILCGVSGCNSLRNGCLSFWTVNAKKDICL